MTQPITLSFEVACDPPHVRSIGNANLAVVAAFSFPVREPEPHGHVRAAAGGRIFERTPDGNEYDWGEVVVWDPPRRLAYLWHIYGERSQATNVTIDFEPRAGGTLVSIVHDGWDLVPSGAELRERNVVGWSGLLPHFETACAEKDLGYR